MAECSEAPDWQGWLRLGISSPYLSPPIPRTTTPSQDDGAEP